MLRVGRVIMALFPAIIVAAIIFYVWPRSDTTPREGAIVTTFQLGTLMILAALLALHWMIYLIVLIIAERRGVDKSSTSVGIVASVIILGGYVALVIQPAFSFLMFPLVAVMTFALLLTQRKKEIWMYFAAVGPMAGLLSPVLCAFFFLFSHPWEDVTRLKMPGGRVFRVQHFWEADILTEEISNDWLFLRTKLIVGNYNEYAAMAIVRPEGPEYDFSESKNDFNFFVGNKKLVTSTDGNFVVYIYPYTSYPNKKVGCATKLVHNYSTGESWGFHPQFADIYNLSPFVLVGSTDRINVGDVEAMIEGDGAWVYPCNNEEVIAALRKHENPWVRVAVAEWQGTSEEEALRLEKDLMQEAANHPDPKHRNAAQEALDWMKALRAGG